MKRTIRNLKYVYNYGKEYKKALIFESIGSIFGIIIGIILPILSAKQVVYLTPPGVEESYFERVESINR